MALSTQQNAVRTESGLLVTSRFHGTFCDIEDAPKLFLKIHSEDHGKYMNITKLVSEVGTDGSLTLPDLLRACLKETLSDGGILYQAQFQFPSSAFISGYFPPTPSDQQPYSSLFLRKSSLKIYQLLEAKTSFYGSSRFGLNEIMVKSHE